MKTNIPFAFGIILISCLSNENGSVDPKKAIQGNWKYQSCFGGCFGGEIYKIKLFNDSVFSERLLFSDALCVNCPCEITNKRVYAKGKFNIEADTIKLNLLMTDSNYFIKNDSCGFVKSEAHKFSITQDGFIFHDSINSLTKNRIFKRDSI